MQIFKPRANIKEPLNVLVQFFFLRCCFSNILVQLCKFLWTQQSNPFHFIFNIFGGSFSVQIQIMNGNGNFSVDDISGQFFKNRGTFVFGTFQELVEFALRKHHRLGKLIKVKANDTRHGLFDFRLVRERCFC